MIIKIVKLIIEKEKVDEFQLFFKKSKLSISNFNVNNYVVLIKETEERNIFFSCSYWKNEEMFENYRNSNFFQGLWKNTKTYFSGKSKAWSINKIDL